MRRIAVINQKGGVGKTTTTANLGAAMARAGREVLLVDLDPQGHLTLHLGTPMEEGQTTVYDVLVDSAPVANAAYEVRDRLTVVPADIDLAAAETELVGVVGREMILREALSAYETRAEFMLIDCPPSLGVLTVNALVAAEEVIIPLQPHFFALQGLGKLLDTISVVRQRVNPRLRVSGIALCLFDSGTKLAAEVVQDLDSFLTSARGTAVPWADAVIYQTRVRRNIKLAESASFGQTVFDYDSRSHGAIDYQALATEVMNQVLPDPPPISAQPATRRIVPGHRAAPNRSAQPARPVEAAGQPAATTVPSSAPTPTPDPATIPAG